MKPDAGFTLIEMLVVLTIIGLIAAVSLGRVSGRPAFVDRARLRSGFDASVSRASLAAMQSGRPVSIDLRDVEAVHAAFVTDVGHGTPLAFPDGSTSGGTLLLAGRPLLTLDWMTGRLIDARR